MDSISTGSPLSRATAWRLKVYYWIAKHPCVMVGLFALALLVGLGFWQSSIDRELPRQSRTCLIEAVFDFSLATPPACEETLSKLVRSVDPQANPFACRPEGGSPISCGFRESGAPRLFVWLDNLFVDAYTTAFIVGAVAWYRRMSKTSESGELRRRILLSATVVLCVVGGLVDHIENFWLLAHIGVPGRDSNELAGVAALSAWKFRLFILNGAVLLAWIGAALLLTPRPPAGPPARDVVTDAVADTSAG